MDQNQRDAVAVRAMLQPDGMTLGAVKLRSVTLGSLSLLKATRNEFLMPTGPERLNPVTGEVGPSLQNDLFAALAFAYIHGAPLEEVRRYAWSEAVFRDKVIEWGESIPADAMPPLMAQIEQWLEQMNALEFAVQPKPEKPGEQEDAPPN